MATTKRMPTELELDSRQRLPMGKLVHAGQHRFRVTPLEGGDYLLSPVASISERELAMLRSPHALASLQKGIDQAARGEGTVYPAGHFGQLAAQDDEDE